MLLIHINQNFNYFAYKLDYETAGQWDGNIGRESWKSAKNTGNTRKYDFNYVPSKRLSSALYSGGVYAQENYSLENITYDKNGNIQTFWRKGMTTANGTAFGYTDQMTYFYSGNRLSGITDAVNGNLDVQDFRDNGSNSDYTYWADGSLKSDGNRGISMITWDTYLKKETEISYWDGRWIRHFYDGSGKRIKSTDSEGIVWEYIGAMIYKNGSLYQINADEGRIVYENGQYAYEFSYQDHLGNTRVSFRAEGTRLTKTAESAFDPWGLRLSGIGSENKVQNRWELQGKSSEQTFGLNRVDFGARTLNPTTGVWDRVDPLADKMPGWSPYSFSFNNPLRFTDPDGMRPIPLLDKFKNWTWKIDSWFGKRNTGLAGASTFHRGIDFNYSGGGNTDLGAPILSTHDGTVTSAKNTATGGEGRMVIVTSPDGTFRTRYFHLSNVLVEEGQNVSESALVGKMGGSANGKELGRTAHLHYEIQQQNENGDWESIDPTQGNGKNSSNIVDPQKWIKSNPNKQSLGDNPTTIDNPNIQTSQDATRVNNNSLWQNIKEFLK